MWWPKVLHGGCGSVGCWLGQACIEKKKEHVKMD